MKGRLVSDTYLAFSGCVVVTLRRVEERGVSEVSFSGLLYIIMRTVSLVSFSR